MFQNFLFLYFAKSAYHVTDNYRITGHFLHLPSLVETDGTFDVFVAQKASETQTYKNSKTHPQRRGVYQLRRGERMIPFFKYQAKGNDFVIISIGQGERRFSVKEIKPICCRLYGVGAGGWILIEKHKTADFNLVYYISD